MNAQDAPASSQQMLDAVREHRRILSEHGYRPIAIYTPGARLHDGIPIKGAGKRPVSDDWLKLAQRDPPDAVTRAVSSLALNTGIVTGQVCGCDVDVLIADVVDEIMRLIEGTLGPTPLRRIGRSPKILLCYRAEEPFTKLSTPIYRMPDGSLAHFEILGQGQQFVAFGTHPETMRPYYWLDRSPLDVSLGELPVITAMQARDLVGAAAAILLGAGGAMVQKDTSKPRRRAAQILQPAGAGGFFRAVNNAALGSIAAWVSSLHPDFRDRGNSGWRLSSQDLGRDLEEDIAVHPDGIRDFGEEEPLTAIDLVIRLDRASTATQAALWLCERLGLNPLDLGWRGGVADIQELDPEPIDPDPDPDDKELPGPKQRKGKRRKKARSGPPGDEPPPRLDDEPPEEVQPLGEGELRLPKGFRLDPKTGLWFQPAARNDGEVPDPIWICAPFRVLAATADEHNRSHGLLIEWTDDRAKEHRWALPRRLVHADGNIIASELEDAGQRCSTTRAGHEALKRFFGGVRINQYWRCVTRPGWHGTTYVLPSGRVFGDGTIVMQSESAAASTAFTERGTLQDWQKHVARYAIGNDVAVVAISSAFAGPFLEILNDPSGGVHFHGKSQTGKTTLLCIAASAWGPADSEGQLRNWRATDNGLEGAAAQRCDGFLPLDETNQATPQDIINIIYTLSNQSGKARADRTGAARPIATWRVVILSTGETTIAARVGEARKRTTAGSDVRLLNVPADGGKQLGVWQELHGFADGGALTDHLREAARVNCGTAGPAFLERLVADRAQKTAQWRAASATFVQDALGDHASQADGQVRSAAVRFALIAVAGEAAIEYGIVPWQPGTARRAALRYFTRWRTARGGDKAAEDIAALRMLANVVATHGTSRFAPARKPAANKWGDEPGLPRINNQLGYVELDQSDAVIEYWFSAAVWRELCHDHGLEPGSVIQAIDRAGFLHGATTRHQADQKRVWGSANPVRVYRIAAEIVDYNQE